MKKIIILIISITFIQNSNLLGMLLKKIQIISQKNMFTDIKQCSNKNFNYDEIIFNVMKQITALEQKNKSLHQENTFLKLEIEYLLTQQKECESKINTQSTISFVSQDKRSSGNKE